VEPEVVEVVVVDFEEVVEVALVEVEEVVGGAVAVLPVPVDMITAVV
jgi:hypothetical protein